MSTRRAKRIGLIEPPRELNKTTKHKITIFSKNNKNSKKIFIITIFECKTSITIYIGSPNIYCIDCQLLKNINTGIPYTGILTKARWDIECSIDNYFKKGNDSPAQEQFKNQLYELDDSILIIKLLLSYIKNNYPTVHDIIFTDMSTKECDDKSSVNLASMKVFTDGKTWYETHFDVKMGDIYKELYDKMKIQANKIKSELQFDNFMGYAIIDKLAIEKEELKKIYNEARTWQDFFSQIREKIGVSKYCIWLGTSNWFDNFVRTILQFNTLGLQFIFEPKEYITYSINEYTGGRHTTIKKYSKQTN